MRAAVRKWMSRLVRLVVCGVAVGYLYTKVSWYDYATLARQPDAPCRVLGSSTDDPLRLADPRTGREFAARQAELIDPSRGAPPARRPIELGLRTLIRRMDRTWALWAVAALAPTTFIIGWRLRYLLAMQSVHVSFREAVLLTFAGNFFNFALPGTTGGDLYKAYHVARRAPRRTEAVTVVLIDRAIGFVNFILLAGVCILFSWRRNAIGRLGELVGLLIIALVVGSMIFFSRRFRRWIGYDALLRRLPMADRLRRVDQTAFSLRHHPRQTLVAMLGTTINNGFLALSILYLGRSLGMGPQRLNEPLDVAAFFVACMLSLSVGYLVAAVPISVQGFGLLEAVFLRVLSGTWGTASQVVALCLGFRAVQLLWSLPGIAVPWLGLRPPPNEEAAQMLGAGPESAGTTPAS